ncbi:MAG TPA: FAD-dependent oxidoreductase, partial [Natrialbaceae archaeon]|nr:FAD-dependent oxidoreductase [Natrialbaceae archaeon]
MIGVVGGGIAGLAAAYRLQEHGYEVQVFEASD